MVTYSFLKSLHLFKFHIVQGRGRRGRERHGRRASSNASSASTISSSNGSDDAYDPSSCDADTSSTNESVNFIPLAAGQKKVNHTRHQRGGRQETTAVARNSQGV